MQKPAGFRITRTIEGRYFQAAALILVRLLHRVRLGKVPVRLRLEFGLQPSAAFLYDFTVDYFLPQRVMFTKKKKVLDHYPRSSTRYRTFVEAFQPKAKADAETSSFQLRTGFDHHSLHFHKSKGKKKRDLSVLLFLIRT